MADEKYADFIEVFKGEDDQWYYRGKSNNGQTLYTSEGYSKRSSAIDAGAKAAKDADIASIVTSP